MWGACGDGIVLAGSDSHLTTFVVCCSLSKGRQAWRAVYLTGKAAVVNSHVGRVIV